MKRIIMVVAIPLLVVLSASFGAESQTYKGPATTKLVPEVSKFGTLTNLKDEKGRRLFSKPIQEGFYVRFRVGEGKEQIIYAIGDRISNPKVSYSGYQEKISGAGLTTQNGLNVTSGFVFDKSKGTLQAIRTIVNPPIPKKKATMYLSEVKNYFDTKLLALRTEIGSAKTVIPLPSLDGSTSNCWPCQPWPECQLVSPVLYPSRATVICINCKKDATGIAHVVSLADLERQLNEYREEGCEHLIAYTGIDARAGESLYPDDILETQAKVKSLSGEGVRAIGQELSETDVKRLLTLQAGAAIVLKTEYKIVAPRK